MRRQAHVSRIRRDAHEGRPIAKDEAVLLLALPADEIVARCERFAAGVAG